jgi:hypothetical protein
LHLKDGLAVTKAQTRSGVVAPVEQDGFTRLISTPYFMVDRFLTGAGSSKDLELRGRMQILVALNAGASVRPGDGASVQLPAGRAAVLPGLEGAQYVLEGPGNAEVIRVSTAVR